MPRKDRLRGLASIELERLGYALGPHDWSDLDAIKDGYWLAVVQAQGYHLNETKTNRQKEHLSRLPAKDSVPARSGSSREGGSVL